MSETQRPATSPVLMAVVVSLIFGGLAGGLAGYAIRNTSLTSSSVGSVTKSAALSVKEESATTDVVKKADAAVVSIVVTKDYSKIYDQQQTSPFDNFFFGFPSQQQPQGKQEVCGGSGFIVQNDGLIVTNKHVICEQDAEYTVTLNDGKKYEATVKALDPSNDIAILKIEAKNLTTLELGDSDGVVIGQTAIAIGNALGQYRNTVTKGVISGKSRTITASAGRGVSETLEDVFQTDASINPGNSGGPLINLAGQVIGMNTAVDQEGQLIGFAIPSNAIRKDIESVEKTGTIVRPYLGVRYALITEAMAEANTLAVQQGALIQRGTGNDELAVIPGGPADKAGLVENDIITHVNGKEISADHSLTGLLSAYNPGDEVTMTIYHKGEKRDIKVKLEEKK